MFHDIDIMVDEKDVERCKNILLNMGTMGAASPDPQFKTRTFIEFTVDEVEIDVIAGFVIVDLSLIHILKIVQKGEYKWKRMFYI